MRRPLHRGQAATQTNRLRTVKVVLMGTSVFAPSRAMVLKIGCEDLFQKPVNRPTLRFLLARLTSKMASPRSSAPALQNTPAPKLAGRHLLYAEDSLPSQAIMKRMLHKAGAKTTVVANGAAAVEAALNNPTLFDCILMVRLLLFSPAHRSALCQSNVSDETRCSRIWLTFPLAWNRPFL
jgi:CheY-like chemotaxis protein